MLRWEYRQSSDFTNYANATHAEISQIQSDAAVWDIRIRFKRNVRVIGKSRNLLKEQKDIGSAEFCMFCDAREDE